LQNNGINVPDFILASKDNVEKIVPFIKEKEFILKPRGGCFGLGIVRFNKPEELIDVVDYSSQQTHFLEEFVPNDFDDWIGVNVVGGKVVYGYGKKAETIAGWKVFDRKQEGGRMLLRKPDKEQEKIAIACGKAMNLDIYGVDIIKSSENGKYYAIDVNTSPGLYPEMFSEARVDGAKEIANFIESKL
jgi:glutathione synthase/RimK-type ligase-like ATP-grasp enzyme